MTKYQFELFIGNKLQHHQHTATDVPLSPIRPLFYSPSTTCKIAHDAVAVHPSWRDIKSEFAVRLTWARQQQVSDKQCRDHASTWTSAVFTVYSLLAVTVRVEGGPHQLVMIIKSAITVATSHINSHFPPPVAQLDFK